MPLPKEACEKLAEINQDAFGFYRLLADGRIEFMSFCKPGIRNFIAIPEDDFKELAR